MPLARIPALRLDSAYARYRAGALAAADSAFVRVLSVCPGEPGALAGRGFIALRRGELDRARELFTRSLASLPTGYDALTGLGMTAYRQGDPATARSAFTNALAQVPGDSLSRWYLARLPVPETQAKLGPVVRPEATRVDARVGRRVFEVPDDRGEWRPFWVKGVNLGAALPGRHPSEFPADDGTYDRWIERVANLGANALRVYTIHPPHFYRALAAWNAAHPDRPLWLIHGVWTELPPGPREERYDDPVWRDAFRAEMRRVVDLLHGRAAIPPRPGHASGIYAVDLSRWVLAYVIGREWEPHSVLAYAQAHPNRSAFRGRFIGIEGGNAAETWLAEECDYLVGYELGTYNTERPIAYTNWPTLDPLRHVTESTREEEDRLRRWTLPEPNKEYDNDAIGLDGAKLRATAAYRAGVFASYHAYPYYPDFMVLDPGYAAARSPEGPSPYFGYLDQLVRHHGDMPVLIAEYGVPSSRGMAHWQPEGWHHGGHSETEQGRIDARLTRDIHAAGAAGAVIFSLIDEWFKKNWLVIDFEVPAERNRLWLNPLDPEQNYGLIAMRPGAADSEVVIDGRADDWKALAPWWRAPRARAGDPLALEGLWVRSDEAYLYLRLDVGAIDWTRARYVIGVDTYRSDLGSHALPHVGGRCAPGLEFAIDLRGPDSGAVLVDRPYSLYRTGPVRGADPPQTAIVYNRPWRSVAHDDARWDPLVVESNRARIGRDGTFYPARRYDRSRLRFADQRTTTLADWYADPATGVIELRIPWGMLEVLDPSSRQVLHGVGEGGEAETVTTDGLGLVLASYDPARPRGQSRVVGCGGAGDPVLPRWSWAPWETPRWHAVVKPAYEAMRQVFERLGPDPEGSGGRGLRRR